MKRLEEGLRVSIVVHRNRRVVDTVTILLMAVVIVLVTVKVIVTVVV